MTKMNATSLEFLRAIDRSSPKDMEAAAAFMRCLSTDFSEPASARVMAKDLAKMLTKFSK